jgi:hypothetical protein
MNVITVMAGRNRSNPRGPEGLLHVECGHHCKDKYLCSQHGQTKHVKCFPFLVLRVGLPGIQTQSNVWLYCLQRDKNVNENCPGVNAHTLTWILSVSLVHRI